VKGTGFNGKLWKYTSAWAVIEQLGTTLNAMQANRILHPVKTGLLVLGKK
jgi:hypothetical protein